MGQNSAHPITEESEAKRYASRHDLLNDQIKTGTHFLTLSLSNHDLNLVSRDISSNPPRLVLTAEQ